MLEIVEVVFIGLIGIVVVMFVVIGIGFMCMMGCFNWGWFVLVIIGIVLIFLVGIIVDGFL